MHQEKILSESSNIHSYSIRQAENFSRKMNLGGAIINLFPLSIIIHIL